MSTPRPPLADFTHKQEIAAIQFTERFRHDPEAAADFHFLCVVGAGAIILPADDEHGATTLRDYRRLRGLVACIARL